MFVMIMGMFGIEVWLFLIHNHHIAVKYKCVGEW